MIISLYILSSLRMRGPIPLFMRLSVRVTPNAKITEITGWQDGVLKIRLAAPPVEGRANEVLLRFLAKKLRLPFTSLSLHNGSHSRLKCVEIPDDTDIKSTL